MSGPLIDCCNGSVVQATRGLSVLIEKSLSAADHNIDLTHSVHQTFFISVSTQLIFTDEERTSELMYDLFSDPRSSHPCLMLDTLSLTQSVLNVTVTSAVS